VTAARTLAEPRGKTAWAAVVVNHNAGSLLLDCVESLLADDSTGSPPEIVVVDNASTDGSDAALEAKHPDVVLIRPGANLGYARAANLGIAATTAGVVAVLNPDTTVQRGVGDTFVARFEHEPRLGAIGPWISNPDGSRYPSARSEPSTTDAIGHALLGRVAPGNPFTRTYRQLDADPDTPRHVDWVSGAAIWLRREALDATGGWDERFFLFFEDLDLCRRLEAGGWDVVYEPAGRVCHVVGASRERRRYRSIYEHHRAAYLYAAKWWSGPRRALLPAAAALLAGRGVALAAREATVGRRGPAKVTR
jgi:N-acetylglucosaminyl-diphospho-decaprenol L-rhamnosyltransferase